jgi:hypothetical protein
MTLIFLGRCLLTAFCLGQGVLTLPRRIGTGLEVGRLVGRLLRATTFIGGAAGLVLVYRWPVLLTAGMLMLGVRSRFREAAIGVAEGRRSAQLASSIESVQGRVVPTRADWVVGSFVGASLYLPPIVFLVVVAMRMTV